MTLGLGMGRELPGVQAGFRKGRGTRDQIANIHWIMEKARELHKNIYFCFIDYAKAFDGVEVWIMVLLCTHWHSKMSWAQGASSPRGSAAGGGGHFLTQEAEA